MKTQKLQFALPSLHDSQKKNKELIIKANRKTLNIDIYIH